MSTRCECECDPNDPFVDCTPEELDEIYGVR